MAKRKNSSSPVKATAATRREGDRRSKESRGRPAFVGAGPETRKEERLVAQAGRQGGPLGGLPATNGLRRVVVVNDAHAVLALYGDLLEELSYEVVLMVTDAVETDRITAARPDAVVLDLEVGLQADYGIRMAQELRRDTRYGAIPIVIATAHVEALDGARETLRQIGVPVLLKPFSSEELRESLEPG